MSEYLVVIVGDADRWWTADRPTFLEGVAS